MKNKGTIKAIFRGILKSLPFGNVVTEVVQNIQNKDALVTEEIPATGHNWVSITTQAVIVSIIVYAFYTKQITIDQVIEYLKLVN